MMMSRTKLLLSIINDLQKNRMVAQALADKHKVGRRTILRCFDTLAEAGIEVAIDRQDRYFIVQTKCPCCGKEVYA